MGRFAGLAGIKTNQGGLYFLDGDYDVELDEVKLITPRTPPDCFIVSAKVVKSTCAERAPGCKPSQVIKMKEAILETVMGNIKQFAGAALGIEDPDSYTVAPDPDIPDDTTEAATDRFWDEALEFMISEDQPLRGMVIHLNCSTIITKEKKQPFTKHVWGPVVSEPPEAEEAK